MGCSKIRAIQLLLVTNYSAKIDCRNKNIKVTLNMNAHMVHIVN